MHNPLLPSHLPAGTNSRGDGIVTGDGPVTVDAYIDFLCPYCRQFEMSSGSTLGALLTDGKISLVYHPMNFLDEASTTQYSTRAAAAAGCASDEGAFLRYLRALYVNQPEEGGPGLSDEELAALGATVGMDPARFGAALAQGRYMQWPSYVTDRAAEVGVNGTPTVMVNQQVVAAEPQAITDAVSAS